MTTQEMIDKGLSLVQEDAQHDLRLGFRCRLLSSFDETGGGSARRKRTSLAMLAVEKVLPLWELIFPADHTPRQALILAGKILAGTVSTTDAEEEMGVLWTHCDDMMWKHTDKQSVIMVGYGAIQAVREALSEQHFGCKHVSDESTDMDNEPYDSDSSHFAAAAYSGGAPWEGRSDPRKRLEFWRWWLTSTVGTVSRCADSHEP